MRVHRRHNVHRGEPAELAEAHRLGVLNGAQSIRIGLEGNGESLEGVNQGVVYIHSFNIY